MVTANRVFRSLNGRWRSILAQPLLHPELRAEIAADHNGGHPVARAHRPHLLAALEWLVRSQDATPDDGSSRGYSPGFSPYWNGRGWQPSYPETTGYLIPTLIEAARRLDRSDLRARALRAAQWEIELQLESGAVQGGVVGAGRSPAVFNTGQVLLGWVAAYEETGEPAYADAARRAGEYLVRKQESSGRWRDGNSDFARKDTTVYNARVAWALAEAGAVLDEPAFTEAAGRNLRRVAALQHTNGWFPHCCLVDPSKPLLHTLGYTIRGLLEGARVLGDEQLLAAAIKPARAIHDRVREDGWLPGRFHPDWSGAVEWSCLTGNAQLVNSWVRLWTMTGDDTWLDPVDRVLRFIKRTQNRESPDPGIRGGIKGSAPIDGEYGRHELLNWSTKFFADALMRHEDAQRGDNRPDDAFRLA